MIRSVYLYILASALLALRGGGIVAFPDFALSFGGGSSCTLLFTHDACTSERVLLQLARASLQVLFVLNVRDGHLLPGTHILHPPRPSSAPTFKPLSVVNFVHDA